MSDPIRQVIKTWRARADQQGAIYASGIQDCLDDIEAALAAWPLDALLTDLRELETIYARDGLAHPEARQIERIFDKWRAACPRPQEAPNGNQQAIEASASTAAAGWPQDPPSPDSGPNRQRAPQAASRDVARSNEAEVATPPTPPAVIPSQALTCRYCGISLLADGEGGWTCPRRDEH